VESRLSGVGQFMPAFLPNPELITTSSRVHLGTRCVVRPTSKTRKVTTVQLDDAYVSPPAPDVYLDKRWLIALLRRTKLLRCEVRFSSFPTRNYHLTQQRQQRGIRESPRSGDVSFVRERSSCSPGKLSRALCRGQLTLVPIPPE